MAYSYRRDLGIIRGKLSTLTATKEEVEKFLKYVTDLEELVGEASEQDFYGTEGWEHRLGLDD